MQLSAIKLSHAQTWVPLGNGLPDGAGLLAYDSIQKILYATADHAQQNTVSSLRVVKWDGVAWSSLGQGINIDFTTGIESMVFYKGELYVGGKFDTIDGVAARNIARYDGTAWHDVGGVNNSSFTIYPLFVFGGDLYASGTFTQIGGVTAQGLAKWDGSAWNALPNPCPFGLRPHSLGEYNGKLVADFKLSTSNLPDDSVAIMQWDGNTWTALGHFFNSYVTGMKEYKGELYAAGFFNHYSNVYISSFVKWDGIGWTGFNPLVTPYSGSFAVYNNLLYILRLTPPGSSTNPYINIASWDGENWGPSINLNDFAGDIIAIPNDGIYITGAFTQIDGVQLNHIGKYIPAPDPPQPANAILFPNPATTEVNLYIDENEKEIQQLQLYDCLGRIILKAELKPGKNTIDINTIITGMYLYTIGITNIVSKKGKLIIK